MRLAIRLARRAEGRTSPNPMVGAVLVRDGKVIATGFHRKAGGPHAEMEALRAAGGRAKGCDLYINIEPCTHFGKTPPCLPEVIASGIKRAFVGMIDPNPLVREKGVEGLRKAGIEVHTGVLEKECGELNEAFAKFITRGVPFVTLKAAVSLDGRTATEQGGSKWISGEPSRKLVHRMRAASDAVLVGVGTVLRDDPKLTARGVARTARQALRIILDGSLRTPPEAAVFKERTERGVLVVAGEDAPERRKRAIEAAGAEVLSIPAKDGMIDLRRLLKELGRRRRVSSLLVEGGETVFTSFIEQKLADKLVLFIAPILMGGRKAAGVLATATGSQPADALKLKNVTARRCGEDTVVVGFFF